MTTPLCTDEPHTTQGDKLAKSHASTVTPNNFERARPKRFIMLSGKLSCCFRWESWLTAQKSKINQAHGRDPLQEHPV